MSNRADDQYCRRFCSGRLGWNAARRQECRDSTACMPYRDRGTDRDTAAHIARLQARITLLENICRAFTDHYPSGINPRLDQAYREALDILAKGKS